MTYIKQVWKDLPDTSTPITASRLEHIESQYDMAVAASAAYTDSRIPSSGGVLSVNGKTGPSITLTASDVGAVPSTQVATTSTRGIVELLTDAEADTGTDTQRAMTAAAMRYANVQRYERSGATVAGIGSGRFIGDQAVLTIDALSVLVFWDGSAWRIASSRASGSVAHRDKFTTQGVMYPGVQWFDSVTSNTATFNGAAWISDSRVTGVMDLFGTVHRANNGSGAWQRMEDSNHTSFGIGSCNVTATQLRVNYDFPHPVSKVLTLSATLDEAFASSTIRLRMGASVGLTYIALMFYSESGGSTPLDPMTLTTPGANIWLNGKFLA